MAVINLPNYIFENRKFYQIEHDDKFIVSKSNILRKQRRYLRNSTHILILLINGGKILHLQNNNITINSSDILFLSQSKK